MNWQKTKKDLEKIWQAGVDRVNPEKMIYSQLSLQNNVLVFKKEGLEEQVDLNTYEKIFVLGAGKASAKMALALEGLLGDKIDKGLIVTKKGHLEKLKYCRLIEASHPVPDESSVEAAREILKLASLADKETLVISLISGGASALLCAPLQADWAAVNLDLADKQQMTRLLLGCGAEIQEVNTVRKKLSAIKGGKLAAALAPAACFNLILSDVIGDDLGSIGSGPFILDSGTWQDLDQIIQKYDLMDSLPSKFLRLIEAGLAGKDPYTRLKHDVVFKDIKNLLIGNLYSALSSSKKKAEELNFSAVLLSSQLTGDASALAAFLFDIARDQLKHQSLGKLPLCLLAGGESTVVLKGHGKGGRNQEMALAFLQKLQQHSEEAKHISFLSAATDGNDGPTDAAGAFASQAVLDRAEDLGLSISSYLDNNDSYHFFDKCGALLKSGPTNTNVCDIQLVIINP